MPSVAASTSQSPVEAPTKRKRTPSASGSDGSAASSSRRSVSPSPRRHRRRRDSSAEAGEVRQRRRRSSPHEGEKDAAAVAAASATQHSNGHERLALNGAAKAADERIRLEARGEGIRQQQAKLNATRAGGTYIPPARLRAMMAEAAAADAGSVEFQRMSWDALKKSITGLVNKVAAENIKFIVPELFGGANLIRGRGLFCRSIMKAQMQSIPFTPVFAALTAIVNTKLPMVGDLLVTRLVNQFRRSFKRNDKVVCNATAVFLAHLVNQRVVHEIIALEILVLLLEQPTDDSVEIAVGFMREVGAFLAEEAPKANNGIFDRFRAVLYEGTISKRVQYMIEVLSQVRRERYKDNPKVLEMLDLVEEDDQITHQIGLEDKLNVEESLNVFRADPDFEENEEKYREIKREILGEDGSGQGSDEEVSDGGSGSDGDESEPDEEAAVQERVDIQDRTETNMINLRRTIYLTIMSSAAFEEAVHKLMKLNIPEGQEIELCNMVIECCSQERTFSKFYGLIGERLCKLNRMWSECYETCFRNYYDSIHRYETNRLRNIARFFGWIIAADGISWACFSAVHMTEEDTTSSSRIFIKILMAEMKERLGIKALVSRFAEPTMQEYYVNMMPRNDPKATRFSINFFTSIGVPQLTDGMREHLKIVREEALAKAQLQEDESSDSDSSLSSSSISSSSFYSSSSYSDSDSPPPRRRQRTRSPERYRARSPQRRHSESMSPPPRRRERSYSRSRSPPPRRRDRSYSRSRSPPRRSRESVSPPARQRYRSYSRSRTPPRTRLPPRRERSPRQSRESVSPQPHQRSRRYD